MGGAEKGVGRLVRAIALSGFAVSLGFALVSLPELALASRSAASPDCPVATPAQAAALTPRAPTRVHAIGGEHSATVTWCSPVTGQANVVSYTVTASTGRTLTAQVPNDYAIFDGLSNGRSNSFKVTANTASASGSAPGHSNSVTPAPIAPPTHVLRGRPQRISFDRYSLLIGGRQTVIYAGEFDPWRLPSPSLWLDRLEKMKADGLNAVTAYFDWDYQSPAPGVYDLTGVRDINTFLNDAQKAGLYVIARPGPYINAETDAGGFPGWLVTGQGTARTDAPDYVAAAKQWLSEVDPIIAAHQITRGGDVILYQVENELFWNDPSTVNYMHELEHKARADGIDVPLTGNDSGTFQRTAAALDIDGYDSYPLGFNCADTSTFGNPPRFSAFVGAPLMLPEFQAGSYDSWGGAGYDACYQLTGPDFENVFDKSNFAQGVTIESNYMAVGGTNWRWLPAPFMYTAYDYGAAIRESGEIGSPENPNDIAGSKYGENKLLGDFIQSVPSLAKTEPAEPPASSNPAVAVTARDNPADGTQFIYLRQTVASSTTTAATHLALKTSPRFAYAADYYPSVPQQPGTTITLRGRDARLLLANYAFDGQRLQYSTSELMTHAELGSRAVALIYGPAGTDGETVLRYATRPTVTVLHGNVRRTWDASRGDLRLDYTHGGLAEVRVTGGGRRPLLLLIAEETVAEDFWPVSTSAGLALVRGAYLVRTAGATRGTLALTGDTSAPGPIRVWAPRDVFAVSWNGHPISTSRKRDGSLTGRLPGPAAVSLPALTGWRFRFGTSEARPSYRDGSWTLADHPTTTNPTKPITTPMLYADEYGFHHGFIWYRGHFTATGRETGITLIANGGQHGAFSVWLNGAFIGSDSSGNQQTRTFSFPGSALRRGGKNVVAVLVQSSGHDEDGVYGFAPNDAYKNPRGLMGATLDGQATQLTWRLEGDRGGEPAYPHGGWRSVSLPDEWNGRGVPVGIGWYRTTFSLRVPRRSYVPIAVQVDSLPNGASADSRAFIFINGWLMGQYDNRLGPQHRFYVPAGILKEQGHNTIAIAEWALASRGGGLGAVKLVALGNQTGGVPGQPLAGS